MILVALVDGDGLDHAHATLLVEVGQGLGVPICHVKEILHAECNRQSEYAAIGGSVVAAGNASNADNYHAADGKVSNPIECAIDGKRQTKTWFVLKAVL
jgi:hypothetical protein